MNENKVCYYALLDTGDIAYVGDFGSITEAFDHEPGNSVWMVSDDNVSRWISTIQSARRGAPLAAKNI